MNKLMAAAGAAGLFAMAGASHAAITVALPDVANQLFSTSNGAILYDFDSIANPHVTFTGNVLNGTAISTDGSVPEISVSAPPPFDAVPGDPTPVTVTNDTAGNPYSADPTNYSSVQANGTSTFATTGGYYLSSFSFYLGSPDSYNTMIFNFVGGGSQEFDGTAIWNGQDFAGDRSKGFRVYYNFNGAHVSSIVFGTGGTNAFESDGFAGTLGIPEPASWALMIMGFGATGAMLRGKRRQATTA